MPKGKKPKTTPKSKVPAAQEHLERGNQFIEEKDWGKAIEEFTEAIKLDPNNADTAKIKILETLAEALSVSKDPLMLAEFVRQHLGDTITSQGLSEINESGVLVLDPRIEQVIQQQMADNNSTGVAP